MNPLATSTATSPLEWTSQGAFASLGPTFFTALEPTPLPPPHRHSTSTAVPHLLSLAPVSLPSAEALHALFLIHISDPPRPHYISHAVVFVQTK